MGIVKNERYRAFLEKRIVPVIDRTVFLPLLERIDYPKSPKEARALVILLWETGARPNEILRLKRDDVQLKKPYLLINMPGSKRSNPRPILLSANTVFIKEVWKYISVRFPGMLLFPSFYSSSIRTGTSIKSRKWKEKETGIERIGKRYEKDYPTVSAKLDYWFQRWFSFPAYIFRHNCLTIMAEKLNVLQLMQWKGAKTESSVMPYIHLTMKEAKKMSNATPQHS
jgi:integrase